jgi:hypothetical protein
MPSNPTVTKVEATAFRFLTNAPEVDGTITVDSTMALVEVTAGTPSGWLQAERKTSDAP